MENRLVQKLIKTAVLMLASSVPLGAFASTTADTLRAAYQARSDAALIRGAAIGVVTSNQAPEKILLGDAASEFTLFEIGSVSKSFAGIEAAILSLDKKLDLESPISNYVPELAGTYVGTVTAHQLATHTARLVDSFVDPSGKLTDLYDADELIIFLKAYQPDPMQFPAGQRSYSNLGFSTLGLVISRIEKLSFAETIRKNILSPLSMSQTGFILDALKPAGLVQGYNVVLNPAPYQEFSDLALASGGIESNLHDMMIYLRANVHPDQSPLGRAIEFSHRLGLGWDSQPGALPIWKNGAMPAGFSSYITFDPTPGKESGTVILTNTLNISETMGLGFLALGTKDSLLLPQELNAMEAATLQTLAGTFMTDDGKTSLEIYPIQNRFLGATAKADGAAVSIRLFQYQPGLILVDNGVIVSDTIQWKNKVGSKTTEIVYRAYQGLDATGKARYNSILLHRAP